MDNVIPKGVYLKRIYHIKNDKLLIFVYSDGTAYANPADPTFEVLPI